MGETTERAKVVGAEVKVVGRYDGQIIGSGHVQMGPVAKPIRIKKALRNFSICFVLMIAGLFVPMLHFVLVPGFFMLSIFMAANAYSDSIEISAGQLICDSCKATIEIEKHSDQWPFWVHCSKCQKDYRIEKA